MLKPKLYQGQHLKGKWLATVKEDGVRMVRDGDGNPVSRSGKPLYGLQNVPAHITDAEIFLGDWESTVSHVRNKEAPPVDLDCVYSLDPIDPRLVIREFEDGLPKELVGFLLRGVRDNGHEGLVLRQGDRWLKVKPVENYDVVVTGWKEGKGKHAGRLGVLLTESGNVGTGFSDEQRQDLWERREDLVGTTIEVACMEFTQGGKFRHPRFIRERFDK